MSSVPSVARFLPLPTTLETLKSRMRQAIGMHVHRAEFSAALQAGHGAAQVQPKTDLSPRHVNSMRQRVPFEPVVSGRLYFCT